MYSISKSDNNITNYLKEFIIDTEADVDTLPHAPDCAIGSNALCIATSDVYILGNDNEWHKL